MKIEQSDDDSKKQECEALTKEADELVREFTKTLLEAGKFDSVRIFANKQLPSEDALAITRGEGNFYATFGQISLWVKKQTLDDEEAE